MTRSTLARESFAVVVAICVTSTARATGPVFTLTGFHRETLLTANAYGCSQTDYPAPELLFSDDFATPGGGAIISAMIDTASCHSEVQGVEYVSTESPVSGSVMQFAIVLSSGCLPNATCVTNLTASLALGSTGEVGGGLNGSTSGYAAFHVNEPATITVTTSYNVHADLSGRPTLSLGNASAAFARNLIGPGPNGQPIVLDALESSVGFAGRAGSDSDAGTDVFTVAAPAAGNYTIGFNQSSLEGFSNGSSPTATVNANGTVSARITVRVVTAGLIPGDLDGDGKVNPTDLALLLGAWGTASPAADLNGDGIVGAADLGILLGNWNP